MLLTRAVAIAGAVMLLGGCGSSGHASSSRSTLSSTLSTTSVTSSASSASSTTTSSSSSAAPLPADRVAADLVRAPVKPPLTAARCRLETAAQRARSPFGTVGGTVYACTLARGGPPVAYDVQVLSNGCFVAERRTPGAAIYGCGV